MKLIVKILFLAFAVVLVPASIWAQSSDTTTLSQVILPATECGDTIDNDGDGLIDFPADPDCTDVLDNSEAPPPPAGGGNPPLPTLDARLEAFPTIGLAPLEGVDLQVWTLGFARGPINYTFYCDWNDPTTVVAPPWDAKADGVFLNPYIVKDICAYEAPGLYTPKVIVERGDLAVSALTTVEVLWVVPPEPEQIPATPSSLISSPPPSDNTIWLKWNDHADNEDSYVIERSLAGAELWTQLVSLPADTTTYADTSVVPGVFYDYRVQACLTGFGCSSYGQLASVSTDSGSGPDPGSKPPSPTPDPDPTPPPTPGPTPTPEPGPTTPTPEPPVVGGGGDDGQMFVFPWLGLILLLLLLFALLLLSLAFRRGRGGDSTEA